MYLAMLAMVVSLVLAPAALAQSRGPSGADGSFNCEDFDTQPQAQDFYDAQGGVAGGDPDGLDDDSDGTACETLPNGMTEDGTMMGGNNNTSTGGGICPEGQFPATAPGDPGEGSLVCFDTQEEASFYGTTGELPHDGDVTDEGAAIVPLNADGTCPEGFVTVNAPVCVEESPNTPGRILGFGEGDLAASGDQYVVPETPSAPKTGTATLPDTGGPAFLIPAAVLLIGSGLLGMRVLRK